MKRLTVIRLVSSLLLFCGAANAQPAEWVTTSSAITFKIKNAGFTVGGSLSGLKSKIVFDATRSYSNTIEASLDVKTITTGNGTRDGHLKKKDYFDAAAWPLILISGSVFAKQTDGSYKGYFKLTLKGITKDVVIPFTFTEANDTGVFNGAFTLNRLDFGVGDSGMILSNTVALSIIINVTKK